MTKPERMYYAHMNAGQETKQEQAKNFQVGGDHYVTKAVQPWAAMEAWMTKEEFMGFLLGNAIKYCARNKADKLEDIKKARHYLDKLIEVMEANKAA